VNTSSASASTRQIEVLLIEKQKPAWQRGKLNGVGGKIEPGENPSTR
jgi:8-oxo-dGTP pyrophosphatase MutT (NUDIX family)